MSDASPTVSAMIGRAADGGYWVQNPWFFNAGSQGPQIMFCGTLDECLAYVRREFTQSESGQVTLP